LTTNEYLFGPAMLVAPIVDWKEVPRAVWLPPGTWVEWCTNMSGVYAGPATLPTRRYGLSEIPVFVRGGSVVPTKGLVDAVVPPVAPRRLILLAFPGGSNGTSAAATVFEDDGAGLAYKTSSRYWRLDAVQDDRTNPSVGLGMSITPHAAGAGYAGEPPVRAFTAQFLLDPAAPPHQVSIVTANGVAVPEAAAPDSPPPYWRLERIGAYDAVSVALAAGPSDEPVRIRVEWAAAGVAV
jgi:hypothetical protein